MAPLLSIEDLRFSWQPGKALLDLAELRLSAGESLFLRGPSGSGKSTLLNLVGGVLSAQSGSIRLLGHALETLKPAQRDRLRADHIGFVFQQFNLLPYLDAIDNVTLPCGFSRRRAERAGADPRAQAQTLLERLQLDVASLAGRPAAELSVGQQQRVAAARALIGMPVLAMGIVIPALGVISIVSYIFYLAALRRRPMAAPETGTALDDELLRQAAE